MKRIVALTLVLLMLVLAFASCGKVNDDTNGSDSDTDAYVDDSSSDNSSENDTTDDKGNDSGDDGEGETSKPSFNVKNSSSGLKFELNEDKQSYTLVSKGSCSAKELFVDGYKGLPVTVIGYGAFSDNSIITSITLGDNVKIIKDYAFSKCKKVTKIDLGSGVKVIGDYAFNECSAMTTADLGKNLERISYRAFYKASKLATIKIPDSVRCIAEEAFAETAYYNNSSNWTNKVLYIGNHLILAKSDLSGSYTIKSGTISVAEMAVRGCAKLTGVVIPDSVKGIGSISFANCTALTSIKIGNNVEYIGDRPFINCGYFKDTNNWQNNLLYIGPYLVAAKSSVSGSVSIKAGTKAICDTVFLNCKSISNIVVPDSVVYIGEYAFYGCEKVSGITIGAGVKRIGTMAFKDCAALKGVDFKKPEGWTADGTPIAKELLDNKTDAYMQILLHSGKTWDRK